MIKYRLWFIALALLLAGGSNALAQGGRSFASRPDPFVLDDSLSPAYSDVNAKTLRTSVIDTGVRNLVLITAGQSQWTTVNPSSFTPSNASAVDNFNIYDGATYAASGPLLGTPWVSSLGSGNLSARVADLLVTNGKFDRVIIVPIAVGATSIANWETGALSGRIAVAMRRLAARGITPSTTNVTFALIWGQGETDGVNGTAQATWQTSFGNIKSAAIAAGFSGRFFVVKETWNGGTTYSTIQAAQAGVVDNTTVFAGGDMDSLNGSNRSDGTHLNNTGAAAMATLVYNAMHASGAPF